MPRAIKHRRAVKSLKPAGIRSRPVQRAAPKPRAINDVSVFMRPYTIAVPKAGAKRRFMLAKHQVKRDMVKALYVELTLQPTSAPKAQFILEHHGKPVMIGTKLVAAVEAFNNLLT